MRILKRLCGFLFLCAASAASLTLYGLISLYIYLAHDLPDVRQLREPDGIARILDTPEVSSPDFRPVRFEDLPPPVVNAFLAAWDSAFFTDTKMRFDRINCGDTVFQHLARRLLPEQRRSHALRLKRNILMLHLDVLLTREELFTAWLNTQYFGNRTYGLKAAARFYFAKPASLLGPAEAAVLAGFVGSPARNPLSDAQWVRRRQEFVLQRMKTLGSLSQEEYDAALAAPVSFVLCRGLQAVCPE